MVVDQIKLNRKKVFAAFTVLRTKGILARANFMCCQGCGHSALSERARKENKKGWVFWHNQDEDSLKKSGLLSIAFGAPSGLSTLKVGQELVKQLMIQGLKVSWEWSEENRPEVQLTY